MSIAKSGCSFESVINANAMATAMTFVSKNTRDTFLEMTSYANKIPAKGVLKSAVTPAATPAQINSVLYFRNTFSFCCATDPIVAEATTVETSIPVDPPKTTVRNPLKKLGWDFVNR